MFEISLSILGTFLIVIVTLWLDRRKDRAKIKQKAICLEKITYFKIIHLSRRQPDSSPIYHREIPRLNKEVPVFDEAFVFTTLRFDRPIHNYRTKSRSSGIIDNKILSPWVQELEFPDKGEALIEGHLSQILTKSTDNVISTSNFINGIQPGHEDFATKILLNVKVARLIIDFSSIIGFSNFITQLPEGFLCKPGSKDQRMTVLRYRPGIFCISGDDLLDGDVIRMDIKIDWTRI